MVKRIIKETVHEYDNDGKLVKETITETTEDDDTVYFQPYTPIPSWIGPSCTCDSKGE